MIELRITHTSRGYHPRNCYMVSHRSEERFPDVAAAKAWIADRYRKSKRAPMYRDGKDGGAVKVGYVIGYRGEEQDRSATSGVYHYLGQDWIEFANVETSTPAGI